MDEASESSDGFEQSPPPPYWTQTEGTFHKVVDSAYVRSMAHDLLNKTASDKGTVDRKKLGKPPPPGGYQIVAAQRIEDITRPRHVKDPDGHVVVAAKGNGGGIHDAQVLLENVLIGD